jgi:hypothetical protein
MSDLDLAIRRSKRLEGRLRDGFGATGRGLHEMVSSVERTLPPEAVKRLRFVATLRNKLVHEIGYTKLDDRTGFVRACDESERLLDDAATPVRQGSMKQAVAVAAVVALFLLVGLVIAVVMIVQAGQPLDFHLGLGT